MRCAGLGGQGKCAGVFFIELSWQEWDGALQTSWRVGSGPHWVGIAGLPAFLQGCWPQPVLAGWEEQRNQTQGLLGTPGHSAAQAIPLPPGPYRGCSSPSSLTGSFLSTVGIRLLQTGVVHRHLWH